jgi:hypothetical protein
VLLAAGLFQAGTPRPAYASTGSYRVAAGGDQFWGPESGGIDQTDSAPLHRAGTMVSGHSSPGSAPYDMSAGPGISRGKLSAAFNTAPGAPFDPSIHVISTSDIIVSGPDGFVHIQVHLHVDGTIHSGPCDVSCSMDVSVRTSPFGGVSEFDTVSGARANDLGLIADAIPSGLHIHGDYLWNLDVRTNQPWPLTLVLEMGGRGGLGGAFEADFDDPNLGYGFGFAPTGPVVTVTTPGAYTVSGEGLANNHWVNPFAPPSPDVVVDNCADPAFATLTSVTQDLIIKNLAGCTSLNFPVLTSVGRDLIIEDNPDLLTASFPVLTSIGRDLTVSNNPNLTSLNMPALQTVGGSIHIEHSSPGTLILPPIQLPGDVFISNSGDGSVVINVSGNGGDLTINSSGSGSSAINVSGNGGDLTITNSGSGGAAIEVSGTGGDLTIDNSAGGGAAIDVSSTGGDLTITNTGTGAASAGVGQLGGSLDLTTTGDSASGVTGFPSDITLLDATATMHAAIPSGAFNSSVPFQVSRHADEPPAPGQDASGNPATIDPIFSYQFTFTVPTLNAAATLDFTVNMTALSAQEQADLLNSLGSGLASIIGKGDQPGAAYQGFPVCGAGESPAAGGCAAVAFLNANGTPFNGSGNPPLVRFTGIVGHFSSYGVGIVTVQSTPNDTTPPVITRNVAGDQCSLPGSNGWCRGIQTAGFSVSDAGSAITAPCAAAAGIPCTFTRTASAGGAAVTIPSGQVCDALSNCNPGIAAGPFKLDAAPPSLSPVVLNAPIHLHEVTTAKPNATDATSGISTQSCGAVDTSTVGVHTVSCSATDKAGNTTSLAVTYLVEYRLVPLLWPPDGARLPRLGELPLWVAVTDAYGVPVPAAQSRNLCVRLVATGMKAANACMDFEPFTRTFLFGLRLDRAAGAETLHLEIAYAGTAEKTVLETRFTLR